MLMFTFSLSLDREYIYVSAIKQKLFCN